MGENNLLCEHIRVLNNFAFQAKTKGCFIERIVTLLIQFELTKCMERKLIINC